MVIRMMMMVMIIRYNQNDGDDEDNCDDADKFLDKELDTYSAAVKQR